MPRFLYATIYFDVNPGNGQWETILVAQENIDESIQAAVAEDQPITFLLSQKLNKEARTYHSFRW
jgi:hypothetical protein